MLDTIINQPEFIPSPLMENHPVHMEFYADQWKSMYDDTNVNPVLLDLIDKMHDSHITSMAAAELKKNALAMKAQAPQLASQLAIEGAKTDEATASADDDRELQVAQDSAAKDEEAKRQLAVTAAQQQIAPAPVA
jgi:hypothetical protein